MQADPSGLSRLFTIAGAQGIGAGRHKKSLNLGNTKTRLSLPSEPGLITDVILSDPMAGVVCHILVAF